MAGPPLARLTEDEVRYLKEHIYRDIRDDRNLYEVFSGNDYKSRVMRDWLVNRILMTADHFKVRYSKDE